MLAPERQTPRPRPPAQMRRSPSKGALLSSDGAPPPPYAFEFPSLIETMEGDTSDPVAATAKMMGIDLDTALDMPLITEDDVSNKSRAELTDLFLQAEKIIKAREQELNVAANLGKTLLETNEALKLRHDALLSRLPAMQVPTTSNSSPKTSRADAWTTDDDLPSPAATLNRIHSRSNSIISNTLGSPIHSRSNSIMGVAHSPRRGHVRRLSASPSALHALSDTNAELIAELTRLHNTTDSAQVEGAQRLRKLEREIGGLRAELEATQRTNAELEEKVKEKVDEERKREREERLRKLRAGDDNDSDSAESAIRDFAPQGGGIEKWDSIALTPPRPQRAVPSNPSDSEHEQSDSEARSVSASSIAPSHASQHSMTTPGEYAVVSQLYRKVIELQEANAELTARNRITSKQLAHAEREALQIQRLYAVIDEELATDQSESDGPAPSTIRGSQRLKGSLTSSKSNSWSVRMRGDPFLDNRLRSKKGSSGSLGGKVLQGGRLNKNRAPLTDALFSPPLSTTPKSRKAPPSVVLFPSSPRPRPKLKVKVKGKNKLQANPASLLSPDSSMELRRNFSAGSGSSVSSRASSFLGTTRRNRGRRSLGSELGSEFGDDWGDMPSPHSSLFDDGSVRAFSEDDADTEMGAYADTEDGEDPALAALRDALTPPLAGRLLEQDEHILPVGSLQSSPGEAFHLVAHAVTARPLRWLESDDPRVRGVGPRAALGYEPSGEDPWETTRYPDIDPGAEPSGERASVRMRRRDQALGRMVSTAHSRSFSSTTLVPSQSQLQTTQDSSPRGLVASFRRTSVDMLIELWIFLQFVVVICMFLYTMSRRGPREVLGAPPRR